MACFLVPAAEAVVTTIIEKKVYGSEQRERVAADVGTEAVRAHTPFSRKLHRLNTMLWGGSALLLFEHIWHGEIVPWFPFLTAASEPGALAEVFAEMSTVGVGMALICTGVWAAAAAVGSYLEKTEEETPSSAGEAAE